MSMETNPGISGMSGGVPTEATPEAMPEDMAEGGVEDVMTMSVSPSFESNDLVNSPPPRSGFAGSFTPILTGLGGGGVFLICYAAGRVALLLLLTLVLGFASLEFYRTLNKVGYHPATFLGLAAVVGLPLGVYWRGEEAYPILLGVIVFFTFLWYLFVATDKPAVPNIGATLLGVFYVGVLGSVAALLLSYKDGENLVLAAAIAAVSYDVGGWVIGKWIGRTHFTAVSPNKTLEGLMGGMITAVVLTVVLVRSLNLEPWGDDPGTISDVILMGVMAAIVAPLGDLNESLLKRNMNIKDMGTILPGHGGVLDRVDAMLFVIPGSYMLARLLGILELG